MHPFDEPVRGRLAPSPTGYLHLGNAWAFLLCWLGVRAGGGQVVLRMEDNDPARSRQEYADGIMRDLEWLGLDWDEGPDCGGPYGPYVQSHKLDRYDEAIARLEALGLTYPCYCTRKELKSMAGAPHLEDVGPIYPGTCLLLEAADRAAREEQGRRPTLRLHGQGLVEFRDLVYGPQHFDWMTCGGDFPLKRSDGVVSYQLAVAVDDMDQKISLVVRGRDILPSTPRQIRLIELLGCRVPRYAHVPLLLDAKGERLAKRHQSCELRALREQGKRPEDIIGYLGWVAGLQMRPEPCLPENLVCRFGWDRLPRADVSLPSPDRPIFEPNNNK